MRYDHFGRLYKTNLAVVLHAIGRLAGNIILPNSLGREAVSLEMIPIDFIWSDAPSRRRRTLAPELQNAQAVASSLLHVGPN